MLDACESIVDIIVDPNLMNLPKMLFPKDLQVPGENESFPFYRF